MGQVNKEDLNKDQTVSEPAQKKRKQERGGSKTIQSS
jgi:hypothetical protein